MKFAAREEKYSVMINLYAYAYPSTINKFPGFVLTKVGDSHRDVDVRLDEQGGSAENEEKIKVGAWNNCKTIKRDYEIHEVLKVRGLHHAGKHKGTEWFKIPGNTPEEAFKYLDALIASKEGKKVRNKVVLRHQQATALDKAMEFIEKGTGNASIIANLCPRFGKTIWGLMLFNEISKKYGNRVMLLPAYWLSVHTSFIDELDRFEDFADMVQIDTNDPDAETKAADALENGQRIVIPISLHGQMDMWVKKNGWIAKFDNEDIFMFADEGDFGTHAENQVEKLDFLLG